jgi:hypothetical protein
VPVDGGVLQSGGQVTELRLQFVDPQGGVPRAQLASVLGHSRC